MAWRLPGFDPMNHLGSGSTGVVVKARDWTSGTLVVIKYLSRRVVNAPGFAEQYRADAAALVRIESPHVAQVYGYVEEPRGAAVVSEYVDGASLRTVLAEGGALEPQAALYLTRGILRGLSAAHNNGVLHRDIAPENVMTDRTAAVKLTDFGISVPYRRSSLAPGHPRYIAPEVWRGQPASPSSDVFAAAAVLLEALTGTPPKSAKGDFIGKMGDDQKAVEAPAGLPNGIRALIKNSLAPLPTVRISSADLMLEELDLAAVAAYGEDWEAQGKAKLRARVLPIVAKRPAGAGRGVRLSAALVGLRSIAATKSVMVAFGTVVVVGLATFAVTTGAFSPANASRPVIPILAHTPVPTSVGPTVPLAPSPSGPHPDITKPTQPTNPVSTGRSQTAISLDWSASADNIAVAGYIVTENGHRVGTSFSPGYTAANLKPDTTYTFTVTAFDAAGNLSSTSVTVQVTTLATPDKAPPSAPGNLHSTGHSTTSIWLSWSPSRDNVGVAGYDVFRDGHRVGTVTRSSFVDNGLSPNTKYHYSVRAFDTTYNESGSSSAIYVTTLKTPDKTPPTVPTGLHATATSVSTIHLSWTQSTDTQSGVTQYRVFRGASAIGTTVSTTFDDANLTAGTTYSYRVQAVDAAGNHSGYSGTASAKTQSNPTPPPPPTSPPPNPTVTSLVLSRSIITDCTTTVELQVNVSGGALAVDVTYTINGATDSVSVSVSSSGTKTVTLASNVSITASGRATASTASGVSASPLDLTASGCPPPPPPPPSSSPPDPPTDTPSPDAPSPDAS